MMPVDRAWMARRVRRVHMIGVGGAGMCGIAEVLVNLGYEVRGSDKSPSEALSGLTARGVDARVGHDGAAVHGADVVVISTAIPSDNPELMAARALGIPVIRRAEMLAELMRLRLGVAVAGTHGKTTTTSMVGALLGFAGQKPTVVVGGKVNAVGSNAQIGGGAPFVVEADESDGTFLFLSPMVAVVTNIDPEHLDHYRGGMEEVVAAYLRFLSRLPFYGLAVLCADHPEVRRLVPRLERRVRWVGLGPDAELRAVDLEFGEEETSFEVLGPEGSRGRHRVRMLGEHNVRNALCALAVAEELGVDPETARDGLSRFEGVDRRFSVRGEARGVRVVDDYGHHPEEIRATLQAARAAYPARRIVAVFQPHRFTRTRDLLSDFGAAFEQAHQVFVLPVYAAGEAPIAGADQGAVLDALHAAGHRDAHLLPGLEAAEQQLPRLLRPGDLVLNFGAGDIHRLGPALVAALVADSVPNGEGSVDAPIFGGATKGPTGGGETKKST